MSSSQLVLDTDILSLLMRKNGSVLAWAKEYLSEHGREYWVPLKAELEQLRRLRLRRQSR